MVASHLQSWLVVRVDDNVDDRIVWPSRRDKELVDASPTAHPRGVTIKYPPV